MQRVRVALVIITLAIGLLGGPASAGKERLKAPRRATNFYLRWDNSATEDCGPHYLSVINSPDPANGCWYTFQPAQEVLVLSGQTLTREWPAQDGLPLVLDAKRNLTGKITMNATVTAGTTLEIEVASNRGSLGSANLPFTYTPAARTYTLEFDLDIPNRLHGKKVGRLTLKTTVRGVMLIGWIELDDPPSYIRLPTGR